MKELYKLLVGFLSHLWSVFRIGLATSSSLYGGTVVPADSILENQLISTAVRRATFNGYLSVFFRKLFVVAFLLSLFSSWLSAQTTYNYTGAVQIYNVPVTGYYKIDCYGAPGGLYTATLGRGGQTTGTFWFTAGTVLRVYVGNLGALGGWNGGGNCGNPNFNGGGASDVRVGGTALSNRVIVAGGGGSIGGDFTVYYGGNGGLTGTNGQNYSASCQGGGGGTGGAGGAGGFASGGGYIPGTAGTLGVGANGSIVFGVPGSGSGGGGYYGGGSGAYNPGFGVAGGGGGGGGSSYCSPTACDVSYVTGNSIAGKVVITPKTITLTLAATSTATQTVCIGTSIANIIYNYTGATGATVTGLPSGVVPTYSAGVVTISGTPTVSGTFPYTVTLTGGCVTTTGTIIVNPNNTLALSSAAGTDAQLLCANTALSNIEYSTTGATGASVTGLPTGIAASGFNPVIISGTPTVSGPFTYTVTLTGGCGTVTTTGTVNLLSAPTVSSSSLINSTGSNGSAVITASSGVPSYNVSWTGAASGDPAGYEITTSGGTYNMTSLVPGSYTVTLTDANGCTAVTNFTLLNALPIELLYFDAQLVDKSVLVSWETEWESNVDRFVVERSRDFLTWEYVGEREPTGNLGQHNYYLIDSKPYFGLSYYRLLSQDMDLSKRYYGPESVYLGGDNSLLIFPNPVVVGGMISGYAPRNATNFWLADEQGRKCAEFEDVEEGGSFSWNIAEKARGCYSLHYLLDEKPMVTRIVIW
jgi:hypothetical protein